MRGMPNNPVPCRVCGSEWGFPKDRLCVRCRTQHLRKYIWTPELDEQLRRIYVEHSSSRKALSSALKSFRLRLGWPVNAFTSRAMELRLTCFEKNAWTPEQDSFLREMAGELSITAIGKKLKRSRTSVRNRLFRFHVSGKFVSGYTMTDLTELFGNGIHTVSKWVNRGWLKVIDGRISEKSVSKFLSTHPEQYDLRRVDQAWFKGLIFPRFGQHAHGMGDKAPSPNPYREVA